MIGPVNWSQTPERRDAFIGLVLAMTEAKRDLAPVIEIIASSVLSLPFSDLRQVRGFRDGSAGRPPEEVGKRAVAALGQMQPWCRQWLRGEHSLLRGGRNA
jgi:hypothetical protein